MDDFIMRTEMALGSHNFRADNAMAMCNVCRDEATGIFKSRLEKAFGPAFNMNGLGACLTCGCLGATSVLHALKLRVTTVEPPVPRPAVANRVRTRYHTQCGHVHARLCGVQASTC